MIAHPDQRYGCHTYSQHGEDLVILDIFDQLGMTPGRYLDIGAHHPFNISNTARLYEKLWHGVNVDANPNLIKEFETFRPRDINLCVAVDDVPGVKTFYMYDMKSGRNTIDPNERDRFLKEDPRFCIKQEIQVECKTLEMIVYENFQRTWPEFISIDVEGRDFAILANTNFENTFGYGNSFVPPVAICVECRKYEEPKFIAMMRTKNFFPYLRMAENIIFVRNDIKQELQLGWDLFY